MHTLEQLRSGALRGARHLKLAEGLAVFPPEILSLKETLEVLDLTGNQQNRYNLQYWGGYDWGKLEAQAYYEQLNHQMEIESVNCCKS